MSVIDPKRTWAAQDWCRANRPLRPIPPVANPCCNRIIGKSLASEEAVRRREVITLLRRSADGN